MKETAITVLIIAAAIFGVGFVGKTVLDGWFEFGRYQARLEAENQVRINEIRIRQQEQLIQVENQKAAIRVAEAKGIAEAQSIINATLTPAYLTHEAIKVQELLANNSDHSTIYFIPSGANGIPLVQNVGK